MEGGRAPGITGGNGLEEGIGVEGRGSRHSRKPGNQVQGSRLHVAFSVGTTTYGCSLYSRLHPKKPITLKRP